MSFRATARNLWHEPSADQSISPAEFIYTQPPLYHYREVFIFWNHRGPSRPQSDHRGSYDYVFKGAVIAQKAGFRSTLEGSSKEIAREIIDGLLDDVDRSGRVSSVVREHIRRHTRQHTKENLK